MLPPLRSQTAQERWAVFAATAAGFGLPSDLAVGAAHWCTWHTRRRTEWAYAVALRAASDTLLRRY